MKEYKYSKNYHKEKLIELDQPCMWEEGGFNRTKKSGYSIIVADKNGKPKVPVFVKKKGSRCNSKHALFPMEIGDIIIETSIEGDQIDTSIKKIISIDETKEMLITELEKNNDIYNSAIIASKEKAATWNCKEVIFWSEEDEI